MQLTALFVLAGLLGYCLSATADLDVPLALREPAGISRHDEPVLCGVPLPKGVCTDVSALRLVDADGADVPAHFAAATRWWEDGSAKWVHVSLQRSLPANGEETLYLRLAEPRGTPAGELRIEESPADITVTTGPLRFRVRKQHFNLLDQVWLDESGRGQFDDARAMLADRPRGARVAEGTKTAWASADGDCDVAVEQADPYRVVIRAEGRHRLEDGAPLTDFITRIIAYRNKSYVTVSHAFLVRQGERMTDYLALHEIGLTVPLDLDSGPEGLRYRFGGSEEIHEGQVARKETASLYQYGPDDYSVFFASNEPWSGWRMGAQAHGKGHTLRTGWVEVSDGRRGAAMGVRAFWQMFPKVLKAEASGDLSADLYPDTDYGQPLIVYPGTARTHEAMLLFREAADGSAVSDLMAAFQRPLTLIAPPRWYCQETRAFGQLSEADPSIYDPEHREVVEAFERRFREAFARILEKREERAAEPPLGNEYGIINYGDGVHWTEAGTIYWDDNYYDFPHALILQFARTGDLAYLDSARVYASHLGEVDNACWAHEPERIGGPRVCPAIEHVRAYHDGDAKVSATFNFYKNQSLFEMWYLTGDRRYLETALLSAGYALQVDGMGLSEPRSAAHALISLVAAYDATGDPRYIERGREFWRRIAAYQDEHEGGFPNSFSFQGGLVTEGFRDWHRVTGDPDALARCRRLADWLMVEYAGGEKGFKDAGGFAGLVGLGTMWELTGDRRYLDFALKHAAYWLTTEYGNKVKDYGMAFRSSPYLLWWLRKDASPTP